MADRAMALWLGALSRAGVVNDQTTDASKAAEVIGEHALTDLRRWLATRPRAEVEREQRAAIEVCIWMAHADRHVDAQERFLLRRIVTSSALDDDERDDIVDAAHSVPDLRDLEQRLTHPVLRELMLCLAWELALSDGRITDEETRSFEDLARRLQVSPERSRELQEAVLRP